MKFNSTLHYIAAFLTAILLVYFFSQSQFDNSAHEKTAINLLTFLEYDNRIRRQIVELHTGKKKNYGGLVANETEIKRLLQEFSRADDPYSLANIESTKELLISLKTELTKKFIEIEDFKSKNAVLRNTLYFLPKNTESLVNKISNLENFDDITKTRAINILNSIVAQIFIFNAQIDKDSTLLKNKIRDAKNQLKTLLPKTLYPKINQYIRHARIIISLHKSLTKHMNQINTPITNDLAKVLYNKSNEHFRQQQQTALTYRLWLLAVSLLLLSYLAYIFVKLQQTSVKLKNSLVDLEFHKYAIDEHSIVSITDVKGNILYANERFCRISQYSQEELIGHNHRIIKSDLHDDAFYTDMWHTIANGKKWHGTIANQAKDGSIYWVDSTLLPRLNDKGKPYQYIGIRTDITAQKQAENEAALLARFPSENPDPVMRVNTQGDLLYANPSSRPIIEHWATEVGSSLPDKWSVIANRVLIENEREEHEIKIGKSHYLVLFTPIQNENYVNLYARNTSAIKLAEKNLNYQATHDPLTQLTNRFAFESKLQDSLTHAQGKNIISVLLYIDLDQFKVVNDTCGHIAGDELLRQISLDFTHSIRETDILARLGGDEFGVILNNCDIDHGKVIANKILKSINDYRFIWEDKSFQIGASIGLVEINESSDSIVSLLGEADIACYAAKDAGRNCVRIFQKDEAIARRQDDMQWVTVIPKALAENRFILYGQLIKPLKQDLHTQSHYELLIRLQNEQGEIIPPGAFIPAAERYGLMHSLDMWVITHAFEMLHQYNECFADSPVRIAINLSGHSLGNDHILEYIPDMLNKYDIDASSITFEITETSAISNLTTAIKFISELKSRGCKFALDDFGSGLSSFAYLKNLPVDYLKIDGAFVKDILEDPIDAAMVQSINQIGHIMNIQTIAEFVESEQIEKHLARINVDFAQGYGIEKPRPLTDILHLDTDKAELINSNS